MTYHVSPSEKVGVTTPCPPPNCTHGCATVALRKFGKTVKAYLHQGQARLSQAKLIVGMCLHLE